MFCTNFQVLQHTLQNLLIFSFSVSFRTGITNTKSQISDAKLNCQNVQQKKKWSSYVNGNILHLTFAFCSFWLLNHCLVFLGTTLKQN